MNAKVFIDTTKYWIERQEKPLLIVIIVERRKPAKKSVQSSPSENGVRTVQNIVAGQSNKGIRNTSNARPRHIATAWKQNASLLNFFQFFFGFLSF